MQRESRQQAGLRGRGDEMKSSLAQALARIASYCEAKGLKLSDVASLSIRDDSDVAGIPAKTIILEIKNQEPVEFSVLIGREKENA